MIGGRWDGHLKAAYDGERARNWARCDLCQGSGERYWHRVPNEESDLSLPREVAADEDGMVLVPITKEKAEAAEPGGGVATKPIVKRSCHACEGTVVMLSLGNTPQPGGNQAYAAWVAELIESGDLEETYAVITRDGVWHSQGEMGWFGVSNDKLSDEEWHKRVIELLRADPQAIVTVVDCHI